jgi:hypothetical protein
MIGIVFGNQSGRFARRGLRRWSLDVVLDEPGEGPVAGLVGIKGGVVSEVINLESSGVEAPEPETTP